MTRPRPYREPDNWRDRTHLFVAALYVCMGLLVFSCVWHCLFARRHVTGWAMPPDPLPPAPPTEQSDIAALTGGKRRSYPRPTTRAPDFPRSGPFAAARESAYAGAWGAAYLAIRGTAAREPGSADRYAFVLSAYYAGRYAEAYPGARQLAETGLGGWPGNPSPRDMANTIEDLALVVPRCYTVRDRAGRELYVLYVGSDASMARRMAPYGGEAFQAACRAVPGSGAAQAMVTPIPVYSLPSYKDWLRFCRVLGRTDMVKAWGGTPELSIAARDETERGEPPCNRNVDAGALLAHETAHVLARASGSRWRACWLPEGVSEATAAGVDPLRVRWRLEAADERVRADPGSLGRAIGADTVTDSDYCLFYALEEYTRRTYGEKRLGAFLVDPDASTPKPAESVYRQHLGVGSRGICAGTAKWLTSGQWEVDIERDDRQAQRVPAGAPGGRP